MPLTDPGGKERPVLLVTKLKINRNGEGLHCQLLRPDDGSLVPQWEGPEQVHLASFPRGLWHASRILVKVKLLANATDFEYNI